MLRELMSQLGVVTFKFLFTNSRRFPVCPPFWKDSPKLPFIFCNYVIPDNVDNGLVQYRKATFSLNELGLNLNAEFFRKFFELS